MAEKKAAKKAGTKAAPESAKSSGQGSGGFTAEERAAMRDRARELKKEKGGAKGNGEAEASAAIAAMSGSDRALAERVHALVKDTAPALSPRTWYGMPAYAKEGKVVCFFQAAGKFKARYATIGFSDTARLDDGAMWPTSFALTEWTSAVEATLRELVRRAASE